VKTYASKNRIYERNKGRAYEKKKERYERNPIAGTSIRAQKGRSIREEYARERIERTRETYNTRKTSNTRVKTYASKNKIYERNKGRAYEKKKDRYARKNIRVYERRKEEVYERNTREQE
jgi:hypothetical protein